MRHFAFIVISIVLIGCQNPNSENVKTPPKKDSITVIQPDTLSKDTIVPMKEITINDVNTYADSLAMIAKKWKSVKYFDGKDTLHSRTPFFIEFINDVNGLTFSVNRAKPTETSWDLKNGILTTKKKAIDHYLILKLNDQEMVTRDTIAGGFTYFYEAAP